MVAKAVLAIKAGILWFAASALFGSGFIAACTQAFR